MPLVPVSVLAVLTVAKVSKEYTDVPNDHPALKEASKGIESAATLLGISLEEAGYTLTLRKGKEGKGNTVYLPSVCQGDDGMAVIRWGKVKKPLADLPADVQMAVNSSDRGYTLEFAQYGPDGDEPLSTVELPLNVERTADGKGFIYDEKQLRQALSRKKLGGMLISLGSGGKVVKLRDVKPGTYTVTGYTSGIFFDKLQYLLDVVELGCKLKANTALERILSMEPEISESAPATLVVSESTEKTKMGYPIIPVSLVTHAEATAEIFEFA